MTKATESKHLDHLAEGPPTDGHQEGQLVAGPPAGREDLAVGQEAEEREGWWCFGRCQRWVEVDQDREENVCGRCHQRTVAWRKLPAVNARLNGRRLSKGQRHELFEAMRRVIDGKAPAEIEPAAAPIAEADRERVMELSVFWG